MMHIAKLETFADEGQADYGGRVVSERSHDVRPRSEFRPPEIFAQPLLIQAVDFFWERSFVVPSPGLEPGWLLTDGF
jgi:hypothetical protein